MTWFKSLIMRQSSPLLLIDPSSRRSHRDPSSLVDPKGSLCISSCNNKHNSMPFAGGPSSTRGTQVRSIISYSTTAAEEATPQYIVREYHRTQTQRESNEETPTTTTTTTNAQQANRLPQLVGLSGCRARQRPSPSTLTSCQRENNPISTFNSALVVSSEEHMKKKFKSKIKNSRSREHFMENKNKSNLFMVGLPSPIWVFLFGLAFGLLICTNESRAALSSSQQQQYFEVQPEPQYLVENGHDIRLRCLIRNRQGECLWLRNGRAIGTIAKKYQFTRQPEDGDCSLAIRNVSVQQDDGLWQCQVTASDVEQDTLQSREVHLVVLVPPERPQIKNMSQNTHRLILEENKTKFIVCEMRGGNPAPQIEWILDNKNISKEAQSSSFLAQPASQQTTVGQQRITQSKLKMSDIKRSMNGKNLTCVGIHQTVNQSTSVELDVQYVPTVSVVQREYSIVEGSPLSISCQVDSNPPPNIVNWRLVSDGSIISGRSQQQSSSTPSTITLPTRPGPVLEFERISRDLNQNIFECLAQNSYGISLPADVKLNVLYAPFLLNTSHSESVLVGSQAQLACIFDGNPEPEVKWHYTDPLSRSASAVQLDNNKQQYLTIKNVTYRNEGDYHCEARNQINGVYYGVRSSNIILDVYGEPQFLVKSPIHSKAVQGSKSDLALTFCSDPPPNKVYWQFGSLRLDVRLNNGQQQALPGGGKQNPAQQRFQVHPLLTLQKRESSFSKSPTCFEAQLSILDPELTDQRDYTLIVQNERGHQSAVVRLRVTSPLSPVLMITSAFVTICGLFLCSLLVMFLVKKRHQSSSNHQHGGSQNGGGAAMGREKNGVEHLANGNGAAALAAVTANGQVLMQQQTRGIVNGVGNGVANESSNPTSGGLLDDAKHGHAMMSMAASDTSNDQNQLLANSDRNSSASGSTGTTNQCVDFAHINSASTHSMSHSTANSTPSPMNHISVEDDTTTNMHHMNGIVGGSTYRAGESVTQDVAQLSPHSVHHLNGNSALIYANLDYTDHHHHNNNNSHNQQSSMAAMSHSPTSIHHSQASTAGANHLQQTPLHHRRQQTPMMEPPPSSHSPTGSSLTEPSLRDHHNNNNHLHHNHQTTSPTKGGGAGETAFRSSVGATIAMMNSLAAAAASQSSGGVTSSPGAGVLNGAINQQLANSRQGLRKPGPPKPPKPSIQQRSRFYQQQQQQPHTTGNGLVMIGNSQVANQGSYPSSLSSPSDGTVAAGVSGGEGLSAKDLAVEYSRIAFPARAEL